MVPKFFLGTKLGTKLKRIYMSLIRLLSVCESIFCFVFPPPYLQSEFRDQVKAGINYTRKKQRLYFNEVIIRVARDFIISAIAIYGKVVHCPIFRIP